RNLSVGSPQDSATADEVVHGPGPHGGEPGGTGTAAELLAMKVSTLLDACPAALELLIAYGFTPLKQPHLRAILAPTVTLEQALRIRSRSADEERKLIAKLVALFRGERTEASV